ncbi:MAG: putative ABC transporter permease [Clostridiales bacterium]|nr:putative ABC transporter permease [Clostridiales bacterium]
MAIEQYTLYDWIIFFYIYSFCGWIFESSYVSIRGKKLVNRGFLKGPFLPIYGSGAVIMLYVSEPFQTNIPAMFVMGMVGATLLELVTGMIMEELFKVRYWDYSKVRFNFGGYICLSSSLAWGAFTVGLNELLHPFMADLVSAVPDLLRQGIVTLVSIFLAVDVTTSVKAALDFRRALESVEEMRREMLRLRKRADVLIACVDDSWREFAENHPAADRAEIIYKDLEFRYNKLRKNILNHEVPAKLSREDFNEFKERFAVMKKKMEENRAARSKNSRRLWKRMRANPSMTSVHYPFSFKTLKEKLEEQEQD